MLEALLLSLLERSSASFLFCLLTGMTTGIGNSMTFSETVFSLQLTWKVVITAVVFALVMGLAGGFAPAWQAARQDILTSLRA